MTAIQLFSNHFEVLKMKDIPLDVKWKKNTQKIYLEEVYMENVYSKKCRYIQKAYLKKMY